MKKGFLGITLIIVAVLILFGTYVYLYKIKGNDQEIVPDGKDITKEEYIYKEDLLVLGYNVNEINTIESKISASDVKKYLLSEKYNNLIELLKSPYFKIEHIDRYESYYSKNKDYSFEDIVIYVEIGLDIEFYTNITEITNYDDYDVVVNKYYKLPDNFEAKDLVSIDSKYKKSSYNYRLRKVAAEALYKMIDAALEDNIKLWVVSAYRTESTQKSLFNNSKNKDGLEHALLYSAKPGHSEHQLGLAVDLNMASSKAHFENTKEYAWLKANSYKYGFIERYPKGKEFITGYGFEPWHYRYLGIDLATDVYTDGGTYEEYLVKHSK